MAQASADKPEDTGSAEKERVASVPQREQLASTPEPLLPKGKGTEPSVQRRIRARVWRSKGGLHSEQRQIPRRKGRKARRASLRVEGSMSG